MKLYKFLRKGFKTQYGKKTYKIGQWYKTSKPLKMCEWGFHGSKRIIDAFGYVPGEVLCEIEVRGKHKRQDDKQVWSEMKIVKAWKWTKKDSVALAIFAAEQVIDLFEKECPEDKRPRKAIEAAKRWLKKPTRKNRDAARAAGDAAWAARAAWAAGAARATRAAGDAAWAAWATRAAGAAWAAGDAAFDRIEKWMRKHLKELKEIKK